MGSEDGVLLLCRSSTIFGERLELLIVKRCPRRYLSPRVRLKEFSEMEGLAAAGCRDCLGKLDKPCQH